MGAFKGVKIPALVGVIASTEDLRAVARMRQPPDLFELRLDLLPALDVRNVEKLRRPLIITARHPAEGGRRIRAGRAELLLGWLPRARFIDVELRSLRELRGVWKKAAGAQVGRICSVHHLERTPDHSVLKQQFQRAIDAGADVFKLVTRADSTDDLLMLLQFLRDARSPCCVMATGIFGAISRVLFPECGSVFVYVTIGKAPYPGQLTLAQWRAVRDFLREHSTGRAKSSRTP